MVSRYHNLSMVLLIVVGLFMFLDLLKRQVEEKNSIFLIKKMGMGVLRSHQGTTGYVCVSHWSSRVCVPALLPVSNACSLRLQVILPIPGSPHALGDTD